MNIKNNILAGVCIFIIVLLMPYYWQIIGYEPSTPEQIINSENNIETINSTPEPPVSTYIKTNENSSNLRQEKTLIVSTNLYQTVISNAGGGSHKDFTVLEMDQNGYKYLGAYVSRDDSILYDKSAPVSLLGNNNGTCTPCLGFVNNSVVLDDNFILTENNSPLIMSNNGAEIFIQKNDSLTIEYEYVSNDYDIVKKLTLYGNSYVINHEFIINKLPNSFNGNYEILWNSGLNPTEVSEYEDVSYGGAYLGINGDIEYVSQTNEDIIKKEKFELDAEWMGVRNKYFAMIMVPNTKALFGSLSSINRDFMNRNLTPSYISSMGFNTVSSPIIETQLYLGPLKIENLDPLHPGLDQMMNFGWKIIQPISKLVLWFLVFMHTSLNLNYGLVLIIFAFIIRVITGPLIKKSYESSQKMQKIAPDIKIIQEKYKEDPQRLQKEMLALYKKAGANPFSGCIPMLLQWPILMALFIVFRSTVELRGESFIFWITDLSQPDYVINLPFHIPLYGDAIAILPLFMGVTMFLVMKQSMATMDSSQKPMLYMMNAMFLLIFNSFPSGLTLYYTVYNVLSYLQQRSIKIESN